LGTIGAELVKWQVKTGV